MRTIIKELILVIKLLRMIMLQARRHPKTWPPLARNYFVCPAAEVLQPNVLHARRPQHLGQTRSRGPTNPTAMRCGGTKAHSIYYDEILILWVSVVGSWTLKPVVR